MNKRPRICFLTGSAADWGGASRVLYTTLRSIDLSRIDPLVLLSGDGPIQNELESRGIDCRVWGPLTEPDNKLSYINTLFRVMQFYRLQRINLIHVNHRFWRPAEVLAALLLRIPVLVHFHVVNEQRGSLMGHCRAAICVSKYVATHSVNIGLKHEVIYNPVDSSRFDSTTNQRDRWGLSTEDVIVSFVGQIRDIKGVQDFIAMARRIKHDNVCFLIAGECRDPVTFPGSYDVDSLNEMIAGDERIRYLGYISDVESIYQRSDIVVVPSRWQEPLGLISLEAGACSKPVVATRVGGIPEIVQDNVNGLLANVGDVNELTDCVQLLINNPKLRQELGSSARKQIEKRFTSAPVQAFEELLLRYAKNR